MIPVSCCWDSRISEAMVRSVGSVPVLPMNDEAHPHRLVVVAAHVLQEADVDALGARLVVGRDENQTHACERRRDGQGGDPPPAEVPRELDQFVDLLEGGRGGACVSVHHAADPTGTTAPKPPRLSGVSKTLASFNHPSGPGGSG